MRGNSRSLDTKRALLRSMRGSFLPPRLGLYATPDPSKEPQRASYDLMQALGTSAQIVPNGSEVACESNALIRVSRPVGCFRLSSIKSCGVRIHLRGLARADGRQTDSRLSAGHRGRRVIRLLSALHTDRHLTSD